MVMKLGLKTEKHPKPYNIDWLQDGGSMEITHRCLVPFSISKTYYDELCCDVMKMSACYLLLGRPWMFDKQVKHDGYHNTYSFTKNGHKVVLRPIRHREFAKRPKLVELMMRSEDVNHLRKGRPVFFAKAKEKPKEEDNEFVVELPFVEGLDSRMSLSQPGENGVNAQEQAQDNQANLQALGQAQSQAPLLSKVDVNQDYFGHVWTCFKAQKHDGIKTNQVEDVSSQKEEDCKMLKMAKAENWCCITRLDFLQC